jgi:hypothetical protein
VFATSNNSLGCTIYQYSLANKKTSQKFIGLTASQRGCDGIAAENGALYVVLAGRKEIRYWPKWGTSTYDSWNFEEINGGVLALDKEGNRLIYAAQLGTAYGISLPAKKIQALASNIGAVHAIAKNSSQILLASGKRYCSMRGQDSRAKTLRLQCSLLLVGIYPVLQWTAQIAHGWRILIME